MTATLDDVPSEVLAIILEAFVNVDYINYWRRWPAQRFCRIEAVLELLRIRRVCRRWRDAIQSDRVARSAFGECTLITDLTPDLDRNHTPFAWCRLFDGAMVKWYQDPWQDHERPEPADPLAPLWPLPFYRQPPIHHWRCGRVTVGDDSSAIKARRDDDSNSNDGCDGAHARHDGNCAAPGGWFDLLVDATLTEWAAAKMGGNLEDDGQGSFSEHGWIPVIFSNQCHTVLETLERATSRRVSEKAAAPAAVKLEGSGCEKDDADENEEQKAEQEEEETDKDTEGLNVTTDADATLNRQTFDEATASVYVPLMPLRVLMFAGLAAGEESCLFHLDRGVAVAEEYAGKRSKWLTRTPTQWVDTWLVPASRLCGETDFKSTAAPCAFCASPRAGRYFDYSSSVSKKQMKEFRQHRCRNGWLMDKLVQRCAEASGTVSTAPSQVPVYVVYTESGEEDITLHTYVFVVHPRTGRLFGAVTWRTHGCGP
ncbi:hypothetical protein HK405_002996 [Cladochytrium tenue]|nr:hypothetical protein HK405_002996 [Cladochytrium tenue]